MSTSTYNDDNRGLAHLARMAKADVERGHGDSTLASVVEALAERVVELTTEVRRLKRHDAEAVATWDNGEPNPHGNFRGVCTCGWVTAWGEHATALRWVEMHRAFYAA